MKRTCVVFTAFLLLYPGHAIAFSQAISPIHVIIDAGHGGIDGGTSYGGLYEKDINLEIARRVYHQLSAEGYQVILNRTGDYALSDENRWSKTSSRHKRDLAQRRGLAAALDPQIMVSLHVNWSTNPNTRGGLVLYQQNHQSFLLADILQHHLNELYGKKDEPKAGKTYYLLRHSICPTVIVEMGYISNARDREQMTRPEKQAELSRAICSGIREYFLLVGSMQKDDLEKASWTQFWKDVWQKGKQLWEKIQAM
ncbi:MULTISPECIES: N-acetylmuramoyl-L-alanine amidase [Bacillales]|jgi:N-acetylmuramoyl-L-alanine amidase|uniref:N-acetylmuramoyl-L-alanine amidase n=1 Tax=Brevibacillus aydinogluensis TaxID=927786 RepID=A0AA48MA30_9BACL|nr:MULTISPECIES: N-acetylmuramoyl-L-alanine amidase [Bacillales]REK64256.1 MAG: N-acetylmuramoyl-L-alanine amidase [Brevibacillus sp.]MBR8659543.1 N-acetylmuramoyl-L-alanine amidase [Brevibacillus sp. NL20B1]MDT3415087.1 N-acetylmuramoyl-L-alanine amidase [Brevibacillus aydinogluensis]NNV01754.1 N-acetylmuramoyl-L-alanine amidase [Brevibacillus sp. MCWH]UFJ60875.1 N-acetylmuramoyl-L-alanine amidase [Anoxybacillus sediminis]